MDKRVVTSLTLFLLLTEVTSEEPTRDLLNQSQPLLSHFPGRAATTVTAGNVVITHLYSTTSTMGIKWKFQGYKPNGTIEAIFVGWDLNYGRFVSNKLQLEKEFEFTHLQSDTTYLVCVEILELLNGNTISHVQCTKLSTIAKMRVDSIVVLLLVLGYFILMPVVGCLLWRRKLVQLGGGGSSLHTMGSNYGHDKKVMRWKDIEETMMLNPAAEA
ncbi:uncharacterized protein [Haliotis asinina]|uniref:uncharacterized protein n=1 Tax=Haliotis asinina TaxID=109174 RepID=UPI003531C224